ncbi:MAG: class I SAM-dependent methyltransferase [Anaerolineae bacterium]
MSFDVAAPTYDRDFTQRRLALWLRAMVRAHVPVQAGERVLELGCGTGEDAVWLAGQGALVTATDASEVMLACTREKTQHAGLSARVQVRHLDMNALEEDTDADARYGVATNHVSNDTHPVDERFDGVFSNFGAVNCAADLPGLARFLAAQVRPGGWVVLVIMGRWCPWEIGWHLLHGKPGAAFRRARAGQAGIPAHVGEGQTVRVWYPTPRDVRRAFAPHFVYQRTVGMGTLLPPSYLDHVAERWPGTFEVLAGWDARFGAFFPMTAWNDHYLIAFSRSNTADHAVVSTGGRPT